MDKETVERAQREAEDAYTKLALLKEAYFKAESDYIKKVSRFRNFDYELAQTDGRLKKLKPQGERKEKKQPELTLEQLKSIAAKLGFNLNNIEEVEEEKTDEEFILNEIKEIESEEKEENNEEKV